ncbi:MAG: T9SS type A sorting domain-containing protein [Bacteroidetes bacterium]|nr:T9SS type A sorting domain-containing protein [Bacteroidota bacterium]MCW5894456.1 T9SS type A sorting domain-containing protein [Bacteroidota bacterium]
MQKMIGIASIVMLALFCGFELYHQLGMVHATQKNGFGCICHGFTPDDSVKVWISGPDSLVAGQEGLYEVHVARRQNIAAGFNVASYFGALGVVDTVGTQLMTESPGIDSLELTHKAPPRPANGRDTISWAFSYTAPFTAGVVDTLYSAGNSVDLDFTPDGDGWNFGQKFLVRVVGASSVGNPGVPRGFMLLQNYPNPFNPSTTIRYEIPVEAKVELKVFDAAGRQVSTLVDERKSSGTYEAVFGQDATKHLSSGVYLYRLAVIPTAVVHNKGYIKARKMLLVK